MEEIETTSHMRYVYSIQWHFLKLDPHFINHNIHDLEIASSVVFIIRMLVVFILFLNSFSHRDLCPFSFREEAVVVVGFLSLRRKLEFVSLKCGTGRGTANPKGSRTKAEGSVYE